MATHRRELDLERLTPQTRHRFRECLAGRSVPHPIWKLEAPISESWKILMPIGLVLLAVMALIGGDEVLSAVWIAGWLIAALPLTVGLFGWLRARRSAARLGCAPGVYLFATDLIELTHGACTVYNLDGLTSLNPHVLPVGTGTTAGSELLFTFGREVVAVPVLGKQNAQLTINRFWPIREALLTAWGASEWDTVAALDPLYEPRHTQGWEQVCHPPAEATPLRMAMDVNAGRGIFGMAPAALTWGAVAALVLAPLFWFGSNAGREALAFSSAKSRDTVAAWQEYLRRDNPAHYLEAKREYLPQAAFRAAKKDGGANSLRTFLAKYGDSPVSHDAEEALHAIYETAIERVKAESAEPVRGTTVQLLKWLDKHHTNVVQVRFGVNSAAEMAALDDFLDEFARERRVTSPLVPIGPSLAPEIWEKRQAELIDVVRIGFAAVVDPDLVRFDKGDVFSGPPVFDRPTLGVTCFVEPNPQVIIDDDTRKLFLRLDFKTEVSVVVPDTEPYTVPLLVSFTDKIPRTQGRSNLYDAMVASAFEDMEQNIGANLFPKHLPERKVRMIEITAPPPPDKSGPMFTATGFCVSPDGYIATAHHFTSHARTYKVLTGTGPVDATLVVSDAENDLAILKIPQPFPAALALRGSDSVKLGESVATIGFPQTQLQGRKPKIGRGEIASLSGLHDDARMFQISVPIQPGNSGGPLLDTHGNVVGVVVAALTRAQAVNFAVKSSHLLTLCQKVPELHDLASPATDAAPPFEDMIDRVRRATVLIEGYE